MYQRFDIHSRIIKRSGIVFYGARDKLLGKEIWMWRLFEYEDGAPPSADLLMQEKAPIRALKHPAIVTLFDVDADPDGVVALLEPAEGESLDEIMLKGPADLALFTIVAASCLEAVSAAAHGGVAHGTLEPGYVFLNTTSDGTVKIKVLGFGLSRMMSHLHGAEFDGGEAEDLHTLGKMFHAMLTGGTTDDVSRSLAAARPDLPPQLIMWVGTLIAAEAAARPASAADALAGLHAALAPPPQPQQYAPMPGPMSGPMYYHPGMAPPAWPMPMGYDPNMQPMQWPQPYQVDPALMPQQMPMWQQPQPMMWQPPVQMMPAQTAPIAQAAPAATTAPAGSTTSQFSKAPKAPTLPPPRNPSGPLTGKQTGPLKKDDVAPPSAKPKVNYKRFIGPLIALSMTCIVLWVIRDMIPFFRAEWWKEMMGNYTFHVGGKDAVIKELEEKKKAEEEARKKEAAAETAAATATPAPAPAVAKPVAKAPAKPKTFIGTGPILARQFDEPVKRGKTTAFAARGGKHEIKDAPSTWSDGGKVGTFTVTTKFASVFAALPQDTRLTLKPDMGVRLKLTVHPTGKIMTTGNAFRFGIFDGKNKGFGCVIPVGAPGEVRVFADEGKDANFGGGTDTKNLPEQGTPVTHPGVLGDKPVSCELSVQPQADGKIKIEARVDDATATVIALIDPKTQPASTDFIGGRILFSCGKEPQSFLFDDVLVEEMK